VHDYTDRKAFGELVGPPLRVVRYQCVYEPCSALWRVLPAFIPRHLWYAWPVVETWGLVPITAPAPPPPISLPSPSPPLPRASPPPPVRVPSRSTAGRWSGRLDSSARTLVQVLAALATPMITALLASLVHLIDATRVELVTAYAEAMAVSPRRRLAALAGHVHRAVPGIRLM
jgi:hypothetical protein